MARSFRADQPVIRILVRPPAPMTTRTGARIVRDVLAATGWGGGAPVRVRQVDDAAAPAEDDLLVEVAVADKIGSAPYATHANDLVQRLYDLNEFLRVEADLPVEAYQPRARARPGKASGGSAACGADSDDVDWVRDALHVDAAIALLPAGAELGKGIVIGHPDSGYSSHPVLAAARLDFGKDRDVISDDDDARDPLRPPSKSLSNALPNPGHGTSTASVMVGSETASGFRGLATGATLVPIRTTESVVQVFDFDVAKAVRWARKVGCHVVSMSLGGKGLFGLQDAIQDAVDDGMIVMAAAGNNVKFVTAPASYDNCIAVAATLPGDKTWSDSSRGDAVDVSAPGACVWCALVDSATRPPVFEFRRSHGTSYAVAHLASIAALWLAFHGRDKLIATYGRKNIQALFLRVLREPGVCRTPPGWNKSNWGAGVVDAKQVLTQPLPPPHALGGRAAKARGAADDPLHRLAASSGRSPASIARWVDALLGAGASADPELLRRFEGELAYHLASGAAQRGRATTGGKAAATRSAPTGASPQLAARIRASASD